ncbi:Leucine rich repeat-containing protein [Lachnospiraceae bacterium XBB1006]|nr:Leucine rich repeat-containing protein [Lachnospiraceae bacterium XBB1006]
MEKIKILDKRTASVLGVFLICIIASLVFEKVFVVKGVDVANIRWSYNKLTGTLRFETTRKSNGKMYDYGSGCDEYNQDAPWWKYKETCKHVAFGTGITHIGWSTCENFGKLTSVSFSEDLQEIGYSAFSRCRLLETLRCPRKLRLIGVASFDESGLVNVELNEGLKEIDAWAFNETEIEEILIPQSVEKIEKGAFGNCEYLKKITLPKGINYLGTGVFYESYGIEKIRIESKKITEVEKDAFKEINPEVVVEVPKEKYDEYKEMLYTHGIPETAKVVAY